MTKLEADLLNHHLAVSYSQLEDPLLLCATIRVPFREIAFNFYLL